jgi:hypothetical protein
MRLSTPLWIQEALALFLLALSLFQAAFALFLLDINSPLSGLL